MNRMNTRLRTSRGRRSRARRSRVRRRRVRRPAQEFLVSLLVGIAVALGALVAIVGPSSFSGGNSSSAANRSARLDGIGAADGHPSASATRPGLGSGRSRASGRPDPSAAAVEAPVPVLDGAAASSFRRMASALPGRVEVALAPLGAGSDETLGNDAAAHGWSTTKVPVLVALLKAREGDLTAAERTSAQSAITESSNESILDLFHELEQIEGGLIGASEYVEELLRLSGDQETIVATAPPPPGAVTTFGQTEWRPRNAVKFFSALARGCLLSAWSTSYVIDLMRHIEPSESWGLGSAGLPDVAFKGGWGPEADGAYLVRQSGIVDVGSAKAVAVAIVAFPPAGSASFETGTAMVTDVAVWLREHLRLVARPAVHCA